MAQHSGWAPPEARGSPPWASNHNPIPGGPLVRGSEQVALRGAVQLRSSCPLAHRLQGKQVSQAIKDQT